MELYSFFESNNYLSIELNREISKILRETFFPKNLRDNLKKKGKRNVRNFLRYDFIEDSCLLHSISIEGASSCTLYMQRDQAEFFRGENWKNEFLFFPKVFGHKDMIYLPHNVDCDEQIKDFKKLWEFYFDKVWEEIS